MDDIDSEMDAVQGWASVEGAARPDQAWLLHDRDVWVKNPCYQGPAVPHPEDEPRPEGPPAGSWAEVAQIMAMACPDSGFDWDAWKDEMKDDGS